ncbi:MAG: imidazole glycerol phosphate synthase subunit HisF [Termitinemataceae bacterium]|nr:MAG: imidazole glycerol phosphate synthase subunit HisF [Termitinemataceae bacterium]
MIIASIDLQNGKVVQLKQGREFVLDGGDPAVLIPEFDRYGEVAIIDLDAAMGIGSNIEIIKPLLQQADFRVGGGIRTIAQAKELISLGAKKIIIGSVIFKSGTEKKYSINIDFLRELADCIGRHRIIIATDAIKTEAIKNEIVINGWKTHTGLDLIETAKILEKYSSEIMYTCVEREGTMQGINLDSVQKLRESVTCSITVAGGVSTIDEVQKISDLNCDIQLGMALYTKKINLSDAFIASLNWKKVDGMIPVIAQSPDGQVLMMSYADKEALYETFRCGNLCFHSRTQNKLWMKGETSGNTLQLVRLRADCDRDALLATVIPAGGVSAKGVCHTGAHSCFEVKRRYTFQYLEEIIKDKIKTSPKDSYTARLTCERVRRKIMEEAYEVCTAKDQKEVTWEIADLLYHSMVLMSKENVTIEDVLAELERRHIIK